KDKGALVTVALAKVPNPLEFGIVITEEDGQIQRFLEKPTWGQVFSDTVNTGLYVMEPEVLAEVPPGQVVDWSADVFPKLLDRGAPLYCYVSDSYWGTPTGLSELEELRGDAEGEDQGGGRRRGGVRDGAGGVPVRRGEGLPVNDHRGGRGGQHQRVLGVQGAAHPVRPARRVRPG